MMILGTRGRGVKRAGVQVEVREAGRWPLSPSSFPGMRSSRPRRRGLQSGSRCVTLTGGCSDSCLFAPRGAALLSDVVIARWADLLVDYCLNVQRGETIAIGSTLEASPLVEAAGKAVILPRAHPPVRLGSPRPKEFFLEHADDAQLAHLPASTIAEAQEADGRIRIAADEDTAAMRGVDPRRQAAFERSRDPIRRLVRQKRWVLTQYPTAGYAQVAGMTTGDYEAFLVHALFLDRPDPAAAWKELGRRQAGLVEFMSGARSIRIEGDGTDLGLSVAGRTWINSDGRRNMPSGEIFTGPVEDSACG